VKFCLKFAFFGSKERSIENRNILEQHELLFEETIELQMT